MAHRQDGKSKDTVAAGDDVFAGDDPISHAYEDRLGRSGFAKAVARIITQRKSTQGIVIGVYAEWGQGKSSALNMVVEELEGDKDVICLRFNPWRFIDEAQLLGTFFRELGKALDGLPKSGRTKIAGALKKYGDLLAFAHSGAPKGVIALAKMIGPAEELESLKDDISSFLAEAGRRVVVIMDDIDRLEKEEMHAIFRLVRLTADFPGMAYVLAFDEERVAAVLAEKYGSDFTAGRSFIEKIVQIPLPLPPSDPEVLLELAFSGVEAALQLAKVEWNESQKRRFARTFIDSFQSRLGTPRLVKHYSNALAFSLPLLKWEVNTVDLALVEAARIFYPHLYSVVKGNGEVFLGFVSETEGEKEYARKVLEATYEGLAGRQRKAAEGLLNALFPAGFAGTVEAPRTPNVKGNEGREKSVSSDDYFSRYFSFGVPPTDVSALRSVGCFTHLA